VLVALVLLYAPWGTAAQESTPDSLQVLRQTVVESPRDGAAWVRLGRAYLGAGDLKQAEKAFRKGVKYGPKAEAHVGLGKVYTERKGKEQRALSSFKRAVSADSTYAPAHLMLAEWYLDHGYDDKVIEAFLRYLALRPDDVDGHYGLAASYLEQQRYDLALELAELMQKAHPEDTRFLALQAQVLATRGHADEALELFLCYLNGIAPEERMLYDDLALVSFPEELEAYSATPQEEREAFLQRFWRRRDLTLVSGGIARRVEHYRRVWYARSHFAQSVYPWDRRGEVYIRYGEPDYRSRSGRANLFPSAAVAAVKRRNAHWIYEVHVLVEDAEEYVEEAPEQIETQAFGPRPWSLFEVERAMTQGTRRATWRKPQDIAGERWVEPTFPVDRGPGGAANVPWESWVYTRVGGGVEFAFTDQSRRGRWDFAPMPGIDLDQFAASFMRLHARAEDYQSDRVLDKVATETPEYFDLPPGVEPLSFHYDAASFRGTGHQAKVEVYVGIPPGQIDVKEADGRSHLQVDLTVALARAKGEEVYRTQMERTFAVQPSAWAQKGAFVPEVASLQVPPGDYRLAVQLADRISGKRGIYLQEIEVPAFGDSLALSDLEMAWTVTQEERERKYRKGNVWVLPLPSRSYRVGQGVHVYYEIYNLVRDDFGQTHYRVEYTVRQGARKSKGLFGAVASGLGKLLSLRRPELVVSYERTGSEVSEPVYFELQPEKLKPGVNQIEVTVTDLANGRAVASSKMFELDEADAR